MADQLVEIADEDELYRRVMHYYIIKGRRVSSAAFKQKKKPLHTFSAECAKLTTPAESLRRPGMPDLRLIGFLAETPRGLDFDVSHEPEHGNYAHCTIAGENTVDKCEQLAADSWPIDVSVSA